MKIRKEKLILCLSAIMLFAVSCKKEVIKDTQIPDSQEESQSQSKSVKIYDAAKENYIVVTVKSKDLMTIETVISEFENYRLKEYTEADLPMVKDKFNHQEVVTNSEEPNKDAIKLADFEVNYDYSSILGEEDGPKRIFGLDLIDKSRATTAGWFTSSGVYPEATVSPHADAVFVWNNTSFFYMGCLCQKHVSNIGIYDGSDNLLISEYVGELEMVTYSASNSIAKIKAWPDLYYGMYTSTFQVLWVFE